MNELYPLTNAQKSIWVADNLYPGTSQAVLSATVIIRAEVDFALMNEAINLVVQKNDALRLRLINHNSVPMQYLADFQPKTYDILDFSYEDGEQDYKQWEKSMAETPIEFLDSELFNVYMIKLNHCKNICFFKFHHTISDAWGVVLVVRKTMLEYWQLKHGIKTDNYNEGSFIDHLSEELQYMSSDRFFKHKEFWSDVFDTVPEFISMTDNKGFKSLAGKRKSYVLSKLLSTKLLSFCELHKVSGFSVFYALLALYLSKRFNKKDIAIETPILNRTGKKEKNIPGMFMHNIPTRIFVDPNLNFLTFVNESFSELKKFMRHQRYPYSCILKDFREKHHFSGTLVDVTMNYHNAKLDSIIEYEGIWNYCGAQSNSLSISVSDRDDTGLSVLDYDYLLEVFNEGDIEQMHNNLCNLLSDALENPTKRLYELQMLSQQELNKLLINLNKTDFPYQARRVNELFEEQARKSPEETAIVFNDQKLSYFELNEKANQLAHYIHSMGVKRKSIVGLLVSRSLEMVIGILGILKSGAAYLPIDPGYPSERITYMLNQSGTGIVLVDQDNFRLDTTIDCQFVNISMNNANTYVGNCDNPDTDEEANVDDLAYVLYTSGSTGKPKGVMVHHRALCNLVSGVSQNLKFNNQTIVSLTTISFDIFFSDTILPLTKGMKVIIANEEEQTIPQYLYELIVNNQVKILQATPSRMKLILSEEKGRECLEGLSHILITGEAFPAPLLPLLKKYTHAEIYNLYGPTETTIWSTMANVTHSEKITIGKPISNTQIYILDEYLSPVNIGCVGEIFIAGDGVSLGYLNNSGLTKQRFLINPSVSNKTMYRTGDLGRWLADGEIECLGRNDNQVKIRGLRIEIEEIEACLLAHSLVKEAIVTVREDSFGKKQLCAYITSQNRPNCEELKSHILKSLPNYMVPVSFTWLNAVPLTPNGKIDRNALPEPSEFDFGHLKHAYIAPRNELEQKMALLWAEALEVARIGIDDNLFAFGGDSLTILDIMSGALTYEWKLNAQDFYERPTIRQLSAKLSGSEDYNMESEVENYFRRRERPVNMTVNPLDIGNVLLTGATGFLGIHLLLELLKQSDNVIYCLVRGNKAKDRLHELLNFYFPKLSIPQRNRIEVVSGDISLVQFGLSKADYINLGQKVQTVIHCAALVKHYGDYSDFYKNNVEGTDRLIKFCMNFNKKLNYISTISISGSFVVEQSKAHKVFMEEDLYIGQDFKTNVYIRSKFIAENHIREAEKGGLNAAVFRIGVLTGRYLDGKFQHNIEQNAFYRRIKSLVSLRMAPESFINQKFEFTPVDYCAQGIVNIIKVNQTEGLVFHMFNHHKIRAIELLSYLRLLNISVRTLTNEEFDSYIGQFSKTKEGKEALSGLVSDLSLNNRLNYSNDVIVDSLFTVNYLSFLGFAWPELDVDYLSKIINYMSEVGFINDSVCHYHHGGID